MIDCGVESSRGYSRIMDSREMRSPPTLLESGNIAAVRSVIRGLNRTFTQEKKKIWSAVFMECSID
jgi:hypothetical protein